MAIDKKLRGSFSASLRQKKAIEAKYTWCKCEILCQHTLVCGGWIQPDEHSPSYKIKLRYRHGRLASVFVIDPVVVMTAKTHVYKGESLCLYYPKDQPWSDNDLIAETIIPWAAEWLLYYELYLISGKWEGPEINH